MLSTERRGVVLVIGEAERASVPADVSGHSELRMEPRTVTEVARLPVGRRRTVVVTEEALVDQRTTDVLAGLAMSGVRVMRPAEYYERVLRRAKLDDLGESWFLFDRGLRRRKLYAASKRLLDLVAGLLGSLLILLLVPLVALAQRLEDGGPVFYRQERVGRGERPFMIWKFRTMRVDAEQGGPVWAAANDQRVTRVGRVLRRTRLDELPQFFNVLTGEMSLVGPRPERPVFVRVLGRAIPFYSRRHLMRPGITGWATVRFGYGDSVTDKWRSHEYDLYYLKHRSLLLDLEILARTVVVMALRKGQ